MTAYTTPDSLPLIEPGVDKIKDGAEVSALANDINTVATATQAALAAHAVTAAAQAEAAKWIRPTVTNSTGQDLNSYTTPGTTPFMAPGTLNLPVAVLGSVEVVPFGTGAIQEYTTFEVVPRKFWRRLVSGVWGAWGEGSVVARLATLEAGKWKRPNLPGGTDFNLYFTPGATEVLSTSHPNQPFPVLGTLEILPLNTWSTQRYTTAETKPRVFVRRYASSVWSSWELQPSRTELDALAGRVDSVESLAGSKSGMKIVPLTMTAPGTPLSSTTDQGSVRWVRRYAVMPKRVRIHVANRNTGNALNGNAALNLSQIRVGVGDAAGRYTGGIVALSGGTIAADGSERVTPWITVPGLVDGGYINITVGWWGGLGTATLQHNQGGGWTTTDDANGNETDTTTSGAWTRSQTTPLHCWIEAEVPASTPVILGQGDSITVGTAATDPVGDSYVAQYAYNMGALPVILAMHGSTMANWTSGAARWTQYGTLALNSIVDAIVTTLGQNDLAAAGMNLATLQTRHNTFMDALRLIFPKQPVYLGAITPSSKSAALEIMRRDFNVWRATLPKGERGVLDFATAVGGVADEDLLPEYSADGLHPNTAGQTVMAGVVETVPVTPFTLSPTKLKALAAL